MYVCTCAVSWPLVYFHVWVQNTDLKPSSYRPLTYHGAVPGLPEPCCVALGQPITPAAKRERLVQLGLHMRYMHTCIGALSESITLCHVLCVISFLLFIIAYILLKLAQKPPQKNKIFLGGACPQTPLVSACFARC